MASVTLEQRNQGQAYLRITVEGHLTGTSAKAIASQVGAQVKALEGRPFGLLFDLRKVSKFDDDGGPVMQAIEIDAADKGLERVAHLVSLPEVVKQLDLEMKSLKAQHLIGNFTDEARATSFAAGEA